MSGTHRHPCEGRGLAAFELIDSAEQQAKSLGSCLRRNDETCDFPK